MRIQIDLLSVHDFKLPPRPPHLLPLEPVLSYLRQISSVEPSNTPLFHASRPPSKATPTNLHSQSRAIGPSACCMVSGQAKTSCEYIPLSLALS